MGSYYNWMQVFGRNWLTWPIPMFRSSEGPSGDGVLWPRAMLDNERISSWFSIFTSDICEIKYSLNQWVGCRRVVFKRSRKSLYDMIPFKSELLLIDILEVYILILDALSFTAILKFDSSFPAVFFTYWLSLFWLLDRLLLFSFTFTSGYWMIGSFFVFSIFSFMLAVSSCSFDSACLIPKDFTWVYLKFFSCSYSYSKIRST